MLKRPAESLPGTAGRASSALPLVNRKAPISQHHEYLGGLGGGFMPGRFGRAGRATMLSFTRAVTHKESTYLEQPVVLPRLHKVNFEKLRAI